MTIWARVPWTEAGQIVALLGSKTDDAEPGAAEDPKTYFDKLVGSDALVDAATFIGVALPRLEAVQWAARVLSPATALESKPYRKRLSDGIRRWLDNPDETRRRELWSIVAERDTPSPEWLLASAIFFSGGSIAPEDVAHVQPPPEVCGKLAASAVIAAAHETDEPASALRKAVLAGDLIASKGL